MKRTVEKIMAVSGIILFLICAGLVALFGFIVTNDDFQGLVSEEMEHEQTGEEITEEELAGFFEQAASMNYGLDAGLLSLIALAGIAAIVLLKKKRVFSAILFITGAGIAAYLFWWMLLPLLPALLYFIAGITVLVRKPALEQAEV
jgi:hypothetical protein